MSRIISWIKTHKLVIVLAIVVLWLLNRDRYAPIPLMNTRQIDTFESSDAMMGVPVSGGFAGTTKSIAPMDYSPAAPTADVANRMVVRNSHLSLKVKDVSDTLQQINSYIKGIGGYMVDSSISNPADNASGNITVRVPEESLDETLAYFRSLSMKVVSENLRGSDVTDQYQDTEERLAILERNKARFEEIMDQATEIDDILRVQQELFNIQSQIDSLKGQQQYLEQTSKLSLVTLYLATDELSLPYAPEQPWRPQVVFQKAVRSLLTNMQDFGSFIIWLVVYSVVLVPLALIAYVIYRKMNTRTKQTSGKTIN